SPTQLRLKATHRRVRSKRLLDGGRSESLVAEDARGAGPLFRHDLPPPAPPDEDEDVPDSPLRELLADPPVHTDPHPRDDGSVAEDAHAHVLATERLDLHGARFCEVHVLRPAHEV